MILIPGSKSEFREALSMTFTVASIHVRPSQEKSFPHKRAIHIQGSRRKQRHFVPGDEKRQVVNCDGLIAFQRRFNRLENRGAATASAHMPLKPEPGHRVGKLRE